MRDPRGLWLLMCAAACGAVSEDSDAPPAPDAALTADAATPDATPPDASPPPDPELFEVVKPATRHARWEDARCNDGTPFSFIVRRAPASPRWLILLQGGAFCDDHAFSCAERDVGLTTTLSVPDGTFVENIFAGFTNVDPTINPTFAAENVVVAQYCSSDFWAGATTSRRPSSGDPTQGWHFSGRRNVEAMFEILREQYDLDDDRPGLRVVFGGGSAGAFGAHFNTSTAEAALPDTAADGRLMLLADAGWMIDWDDPAHRIMETTETDREVWRGFRDFSGLIFDPACEAAAPDVMDCFFGAGWYPAISARLPVFVQQSRSDGTFGAMLHGLVPESAAMAAWQAQVEASMADVSWLHSGLDVYHVLGFDDAGLLRGPAGSTYGEVVGRWFAGGPPERVLYGL